MNNITLRPIGLVRSSRKTISDDSWDSEQVHIELDAAQFSAEALAGISDFSHVEGLDAIDGTPVLDIKPWVAEFAPRGKIFQPKWISELMQKYW